jgi:hypothetical protein
MRKDKTVLVGVFTGTKNISSVTSTIRKLELKKGSVVGVEYPAGFVYRNSLTSQDEFWKKLINYLQERKCKIVFLDSFRLRNKIDSKTLKGIPLTLADAKVMYNEREKFFMKGIPKCKVAFLGAAHAIRLHRQFGIDLLLDDVSSAMHKLGLIPLSARQLVDSRFINKRKKILAQLDRKKSLSASAKQKLTQKRKHKRRIASKKRL